MKQPGYQYAVLMLVLFKASGNVKNMSSCHCNCLSRDKGKGKRRPFPQNSYLNVLCISKNALDGIMTIN